MLDRYIDRNSKEIFEVKENKFNKFLYNTTFGRYLLKIIINPKVSKFIGKYFDSKVSVFRVPKFIEKNNIDMNDYILEDFQSFNEFFIRKINPKKRCIIKLPNVFISPCDGKLSVFKVNPDLVIKIKNSKYQLSDLVDENVCQKYKYGYVLVFRLCVDDYHRYIYVDDGTAEKTRVIPGVLHTVRPIAQHNYPVFALNHRECTLLHTKHFNDIYQIEVGALCVGKIVNHNITEFKKGDEKGYFKFGGSTIVLITNSVTIDRDIVLNSKKGLETTVKLGDKIGRKKSVVIRRVYK